jgi:hypothetical protein
LFLNRYHMKEDKGVVYVQLSTDATMNILDPTHHIIILYPVPFFSISHVTLGTRRSFISAQEAERTEAMPYAPAPLQLQQWLLLSAQPLP